MNEAAESPQSPEGVQADLQPQVDVTVDTNSAELQSDAAVAEQQAVTPEQEAKLKQVEISKIFDMAGAEYPADSDKSPQAEQLRIFYKSFSKKPLDQLQKMSRLHETRRSQAAEGIAAFLHPDNAQETAEQTARETNLDPESKIWRPEFGNFNPGAETADADTEAQAEATSETDDTQAEETNETQETSLAAERQKTTQLLQDTLRLNELQQLQDTLRLNELQQLQDSITDLGENATEAQIQAVFEQVVTDTVLNRVTYELSSLQKQGEQPKVIGDAERKLAALWVKDRLQNDGNSEGNIAERSMNVVSVVTELHDLIDEEETVLQRLAANKGEEGEAILQYFDAKKQILLRPWVEASTQDKYDQIIAEMLESESQEDDEITAQESTEEGDDSDEGDYESELAMPKFEEGQKGYWKQYLVETWENSNRANSSDRLLSALFGEARGKVGGNEFASSYGYEAPAEHEKKGKVDFVEAVKGPLSTKMAEAVLDAMTNSGGIPGLESANLSQASEIKGLLQSAKDGSEPGSMAKALEMILEQTMRSNSSNKTELLKIFMTKVPTALFGSQGKFAFDDTVLEYFHQEFIAQSNPAKRWTELEWDTSDKVDSQSGSQSSSADTSQESAAA
jgi:hypothetical protein